MREVVGGYLGWRDGSVTLPLIKELTFWDRKNVARMVGHAGVITTIGHFKPYRTHRLYPVDSQIAAQSNELSTRDPALYSVQLFRKTCADWRHDKPGSRIKFGRLMLERTTTSAGRNPYLFTYVDKRLITDHNDIDDPRIIEFIKQVILISTHPAARRCDPLPNSKSRPSNREDSAVGATGDFTQRFDRQTKYPDRIRSRNGFTKEVSRSESLARSGTR